jgi:hypothetical protein
MPLVQRRAERGLNAIGRPGQVDESASVRSDFDGNWGFSESARSDQTLIAVPHRATARDLLFNPFHSRSSWARFGLPRDGVNLVKLYNSDAYQYVLTNRRVF